MSNMFPCSNPTVCGVKNHRPGTECSARRSAAGTGRVEMGKLGAPQPKGTDPTQVGRYANRRGVISTLSDVYGPQREILDRLDPEVISNTDCTHYSATHFGSNTLMSFRAGSISEEGVVDFATNYRGYALGWMGQARNPGGRGMGRERYLYRVSVGEDSSLRVQTFSRHYNAEEGRSHNEPLMDRQGLSDEEANEAIAEFEADASSR